MGLDFLVSDIFLLFVWVVSGAVNLGCAIGSISKGNKALGYQQLITVLVIGILIMRIITTYHPYMVH